MHLSTRTTTLADVAAGMVAAIVCAAACLLGGCGEAPASPVTLLELDGSAVTPLADMTRPAVFLFVRTDCPISNRYAPETRRLHETYGDRVDFQLVYADGEESNAAIRAHLKAYDYACGVLRDPGHELVELTGATITPEAAVFAPDGAMVYRGRIDDLYEAFGKSRRAATQHELQDAIEAVIAGRPVPVPRTNAVGCYIVDLASTAQPVRNRAEQ